MSLNHNKSKVFRELVDKSSIFLHWMKILSEGVVSP